MMIKNLRIISTIFFLIGILFVVKAQEITKPSKVSKAAYYDKIESFKSLPAGRLEREEIVRNAKLKERIFPNKGNVPVLKEDPIWQKSNGTRKSQAKTSLLSFDGQNTYSMPSDCNGEIGVNHFFQGVNTTLAIYDKAGTLVSGPTDYNTLFSGVTGASKNDGDPIILFDSEAGRWLAAEFSLDPNYMLIAVSETDDPTGAWYRWSFVMNGMPDYMKFGVWQDGYYMATNTTSGDDIYVFERDVMIAGDSDPQMIQFDNPNRPNSGFHTLEPLDNDGAFAPSGTPGQFITINDNAWGGVNDEVWIYECDVDWTTPENSTFERTQQIQVSDFDADFGTSWENIPQPGTSQKLDAIPQILMYKAQYRNFGSTQAIVCLHAVDVDNTDHAGLRWYELENTGSGWTLRQEGTYAPDEHSRWLAAIAMNAKHEIALGYSISSTTEYPGIRIVGQSAGENAIASGILDIAEETIHTGTKSQTSAERWGDYSLLSVDPQDDHTFWFTTEYVGSTTTKSSKIVSFQFSAPNDPGIFKATAVSGSQIDLSWIRNEDENDVLIAFSLDAEFGVPTDGKTYVADDTIFGGDTILYIGALESFNHMSLAGASRYYYKAWSLLNTTPEYSTGVTTNAKTLSTTPTNHVTDFAAGTPGGNIVPLSWTDATSDVVPDGYIIKVSDTDFGSIVAPVNGADEDNDTDLSDGTGSYKVQQGKGSINYTGLSVLTTYYFKIYPYTNSGAYILYKTDGTVPEVEATTTISYCSSSYSNTSDDWITNVSFNTIDNTTGQEGEGSYGDYTSISTDVEIGSSYDLSVSFSSETYTEHVWVWIDWNHNGDFSDEGEAYEIGQGVSTTVSTSIEVPVDAYKGTIRMRVTEEWDNDPEPCGGGQYGETEDYTLNVIDACTAPEIQATDFTLGTITSNTIEINWTSGAQDVLVAAKQNETISSQPVSGMSYTANSIFGTSGTEISDGYVVFKGVGETINVTGLSDTTVYFFKVYTYISSENCYNKVTPAEGQARTYGMPVITTNEISNITSNSATVAGEVITDNGSNIIERGVVYSLSTIPTTENNKIVATGTETGIFTAELTSLNQNTLYYVRAYAKNEYGTAYGEEKTVTTEISAGITIHDKNGVKVYPNPSSGNFKIILPIEKESFDLQITDINGKVILHKAINSEETEIDLSDKAKGIYFLEIKSADFSYSKKIILQ
jgi:hypothetical protein